MSGEVFNTMKIPLIKWTCTIQIPQDDIRWEGEDPGIAQPLVNRYKKSGGPTVPQAGIFIRNNFESMLETWIRKISKSSILTWLNRLVSEPSSVHVCFWRGRCRPWHEDRKVHWEEQFQFTGIKMRVLLKNQGCWAPLLKDKKNIGAAEMEALEEKAHSLILLCLANEILAEVSDEETAAGLWLKLENLYMTKSLTSKLLLKQRLFGLRMHEGTQPRDH